MSDATSSTADQRDPISREAVVAVIAKLGDRVAQARSDSVLEAEYSVGIKGSFSDLQVNECSIVDRCCQNISADRELFSNLALWLPVLHGSDKSEIKVRFMAFTSASKYTGYVRVKNSEGQIELRKSKVGDLYLTLSPSTALSLTNRTLIHIGRLPEKHDPLTLLRSSDWTKIGSVAFSVCKATSQLALSCELEACGDDQVQQLSYPVHASWYYNDAYCAVAKHFSSMDTAVHVLNQVTGYVGAPLSHFEPFQMTLGFYCETSTKRREEDSDDEADALIVSQSSTYKVKCVKRSSEFTVTVDEAGDYHVTGGPYIDELFETHIEHSWSGYCTDKATLDWDGQRKCTDLNAPPDEWFQESSDLPAVAMVMRGGSSSFSVWYRMGQH